MDLREQIEQYAVGRLSGDALHDLEAKMAADPAFAEAVMRECEMVRALKLAPDIADLRTQMKGFEEQYQHQRQKKIFRRKLLLWALALLALLSAWYWQRMRQQPSPQQLFATYYQPSALLQDGVRGNPDTAELSINQVQQLLTQARARYQQADPAAALLLYEKALALPEAAGMETDMQFKAGLLALEARDFAAAQQHLISVPEARRSAELNWYLALTLLRNGDMEGARTALEKARRSGTRLSVQAEKLLDEVK